MDFLSITPFNNPSTTRSDDSLAINPILLPKPKRSVGRPMGSKNKPKTLPPPLSPRLSRLRPRSCPNSTIHNNYILQRGKRPVGRPKGSNNKTKTTTTLNMGMKDPETVLYIPAGVEIAQWLLDYCNNHHASVTVINATGELADVVCYYQPSSSIPGPFPILTLSCTVVSNPSYGPTKLKETSFPLVVSLFSLNAEIVCSGMVAKSAMAASIVRLVVKMTTLHSNVAVDDTTVCNNLRPQDLTFSEYCNNPYNPLENVQPICDNYPANTDNQEVMGPFSKLLYKDDQLDEILFLLENTLDENDFNFCYPDGLCGLY